MCGAVRFVRSESDGVRDCSFGCQRQRRRRRWRLGGRCPIDRSATSAITSWRRWWCWWGRLCRPTAAKCPLCGKQQHLRGPSFPFRYFGRRFRGDSPRRRRRRGRIVVANGLFVCKSGSNGRYALGRWGCNGRDGAVAFSLRAGGCPRRVDVVAVARCCGSHFF